MLEKALITLALTSLLPFLVKADDGGGFVGPSINEFFPDAIFFAGTPFALNRIMLIRLLVVIVLIVVLHLGTRRMQVIPTRGQVAIEFVLDFVRKNIVEDVLGVKDGRRFMAILMTIFLVSLGMDLTGTIPALQIAGTSVIGLPLLMAVIAYVLFIYAGIRKHGLKYFKN